MLEVIETQTSAMAIAVQQKFGMNCPCCGKPMRVPRGRKGKLRYAGRDRRTVAHDFPTARGGSYKVWVYACSGCNNDQGDLTFYLWAKRLEHQGDPRAGKVYALAAFIYEYRKVNKVRAYRRDDNVDAD